MDLCGHLDLVSRAKKDRSFPRKEHDKQRIAERDGKDRTETQPPQLSFESSFVGEGGHIPVKKTQQRKKQKMRHSQNGHAPESSGHSQGRIPNRESRRSQDHREHVQRRFFCQLHLQAGETHRRKNEKDAHIENHLRAKAYCLPKTSPGGPTGRKLSDGRSPLRTCVGMVDKRRNITWR